MTTPKTETEQLAHQLIALYGKLSAWKQDVVKSSGLSPAQMHTIEIVGHGGSALRMKDLAKKVGVTTGTLTVMINRLERQALLKRTPHETDRRSYLVTLTEKGQGIFTEHHQDHLHRIEEITATLSPEDQTLFSAVLDKIIGQL